MTTTVTDGITSVIPALMVGYTHTRRSGNVVHEIVGDPAGSPDLAPAGLRSGDITLLFAVQADAFTADTLHAAGVVLTLTDSDVPAVNMTYILAPGSTARLELDDTRSVWLLTVAYQEVDA